MRVIINWDVIKEAHEEKAYLHWLSSVGWTPDVILTLGRNQTLVDSGGFNGGTVIAGVEDKTYNWYRKVLLPLSAKPLEDWM